MTMSASMKHNLKQIFSPDGILSDLVPGFVLRDAQIEMAEVVAECLSKDSERIVVEAGTGTGKSFAYLFPALLCNKSVLIATGTKALQDQLYEKDIPTVLEAIYRLTGEQKTVAVMKGRQNYLCLTRYDRFQASPQFWSTNDTLFGKTVETWAQNTQTGDRNEIPGLPDDFRTWKDFDAGADTCTGQQCPEFTKCFITRMRQRAEDADVIIANHHLLCADLRIRLDAQNDHAEDDQSTGSYGQVIPETDAIVLDEAHRFPDTATEYFGVSFSSTRIKRLSNDVQRLFRTLKKDGGSALSKHLEALIEVTDFTLHELAPDALGHQKTRLDRSTLPPHLDELAQSVEDRLEQVTHALQAEHRKQKDDMSVSAEIQGFIRRSEQIKDESRFLLQTALRDATFVAYIEDHQKSLHLAVAPIDIRTALQNTLFSRPCSLVFTSATLAVSGRMKSFCNRLGLKAPPATLGQGQTQQGSRAPAHETSNRIQLSEQRIFSSPFDYENQAALYLPPKMPEPSAAGWQSRLENELFSLAQITKGGALFLFTSYRCLHQTFEALDERLTPLGFDLFRQGSAPKQQIIESFKRSKSGVIFATHSFWEGLDIRGQDLRLVTVDKLPFKSPEDPLYAARADFARSKGISPFQALALPEASLSLKQGLGRLIRSETDIGMAAVFDGRLQSRQYGKAFLNTLPPFHRIDNLAHLEAWWTNHGHLDEDAPQDWQQETLGLIDESP